MFKPLFSRTTKRESTLGSLLPDRAGKFVGGHPLNRLGCSARRTSAEQPCRYLPGFRVSASGANAPPMTGRAVKPST